MLPTLYSFGKLGAFRSRKDLGINPIITQVGNQDLETGCDFLEVIQ